MYTPDPSFVKSLRSYDKFLSVRWNERKNRWAIERKGADGRVHLLFHVQTPDGKYQGLDNRVLVKLAFGDLWKHKDEKEFLEKLDKINDEAKSDEERRIEDRFKDGVEYYRKKARDASYDIVGGGYVDKQMKIAHAKEVERKEIAMDEWDKRTHHRNLGE